jgi:hypothetical protein
MQFRPDPSLGVPPTPEKPIPSYYRYPDPHHDLWLYYDGETWIGEPRTLAWYRQPLPWARGRAPVWTFVVLAALAVGIALTMIRW